MDVCHTWITGTWKAKAILGAELRLLQHGMKAEWYKVSCGWAALSS